MELGLVANSVRRVAAGDMRGGAERLAISTRLLLPALQAQAGSSAAVAELARDVRADLAARGTRTVTLILPAAALNDSQPARIDLGRRQVPIPATVRDALIAQLVSDGSATAARGLNAARGSDAARAGAASAPGGAAAPAAAPPLPTMALQAMVAATASGAVRELARAAHRTAMPAEEALPSVRFERPLLAADRIVGEITPVTAIAGRLQQQLERSGLFFESHLAQWAQGARSNDEMRAELLQRGASAAVMASDPAAQRVALQLALLQQHGVSLHGPAWAGQEAELAVTREAAGQDPTAPPVFNAVLRLDLPRLGALEVRLRLAGHAVATTLHSAVPQRFDAALPTLAAALAARGLTPVATQSLASDPPAASGVESA